ncbi:MAG: rRNA maturation RNase YbeY [Candidatus Paceibacterota bacterium]
MPRFAYTAVAAKVLPRWEVSLAFVGPAKARALNEELRGKDYVPNVLSYVAGERNGEIIICLAEAARQAPAHGMSEREFVLYLFIHGLLHLKGWAHGGTMERCERTLMAQFSKPRARTSSHGATHSDGDRRRHVPSKGRRR